jgi:hypothetical protein
MAARSCIAQTRLKSRLAGFNQKQHADKKQHVLWVELTLGSRGKKP